MRITHSHKFLGQSDEAEPISKAVTWEKLVGQLPTLVGGASAVHIGYYSGERSVEFISGDLDEVFKTRLDGPDYELAPFIRILIRYLDRKDQWLFGSSELFFRSVCTYVVQRIDDPGFGEQLPPPRAWKDLRTPILDILTCKKTWL